MVKKIEYIPSIEGIKLSPNPMKNIYFIIMEI